jgi:hypothetical protein
MSYDQIAILALFVGFFTIFGAVLGAVTWYCRPRADRRHRHGEYPVSGGLITDDD